MQGFIHLLLEAYASEKIGPRALPEIRRLAGVSSPPLATQFFPDEMTFRLMQAAASLQGIDAGDFLYQFGIYFITAPLMERSFRTFLEGQRSARDFIMQAPSIHRALQVSMPRANMPTLRYIEHTNGVLEIVYESHRPFCRFLQGILEGIAIRFHEPLEVHEMECQQRGAPACRLLVRFLPVRRSGPLQETPLRVGAPGSGPAARSGPLSPYPSGPLPPSPEEIFALNPASKRDQEEDVLVLQALNGQLSAAPRLAAPGGAQRSLPLMLSLFEIAQHLKASGFSGDHARVSLIQRSLARMTAQGFVEAKLDAQTHSAGTLQEDALAFGGAGVLAAQRYRITLSGQSWLREMQLQQGY
ncbi:MAG TPA: heme NO-binding domain-containing protein [Ktedonobacterales bacterium]|nr:heme NO-binding domain-containing protein [Ktedonobacterales bacterium]